MVLMLNSGKMKLITVYNAQGEETDTVSLPPIFNAPVRKDLIKRAFLAEFTAGLQPKGRDPMAGKRTPAKSLGVGRGLARVPRIPGTSRGALVNSTVGGRLAHPPRVEKKIVEEINKKEKTLATVSALAATSIIELVKARGHVFDREEVPVVLDASVLNEIKKTSEARELLGKLGLTPDIERAKEKTRIRAGKGKMRGRRYITPKSILFVVDSSDTAFAKAVRNLPGVDVAVPERVSVLELAPGGLPGRLTVYTTTALDKLYKRFEGKLVII